MSKEALNASFDKTNVRPGCYGGQALRGREAAAVAERPELRVLRLAARQHGVLQRVQAAEAGLTRWQIRHRLRIGRWEELFPDVFRVEGTPRAWLQQLKAATLWAARGAAVSHRAAAALHGFDRYRPGPVELTVSRVLRPPNDVVLHVTQALPWRELTAVRGICITSVTRTLVDLAAEDPEPDVRAAVDQALHRQWTTLDKLEVATQRAARRPGVGFLRALLSLYRGGEGPSESELEARVLELLESAGLPRPERQRVVHVGGRLRRIDFHVPGTPILIEADGYAHHAGLAAFEKDRQRNNALTARGYRVLHWTWAALRDRSDELLVQLWEMLARSASPRLEHGAMSPA